jgi:hypothetical protein
MNNPKGFYESDEESYIIKIVSSIFYFQTGTTI